jgi:hypothetical protein
VEKDESAQEAFEQRVIDAASVFQTSLGLEQEAAIQLVRGGVPNLETMTMMEASDIVGILGIEEEQAAAILASAKEKFQNEPA